MLDFQGVNVHSSHGSVMGLHNFEGSDIDSPDKTSALRYPACSTQFDKGLLLGCSNYTKVVYDQLFIESDQKWKYLGCMCFMYLCNIVKPPENPCHSEGRPCSFLGPTLFPRTWRPKMNPRCAQRDMQGIKLKRKEHVNVGKYTSPIEHMGRCVPPNQQQTYIIIYTSPKRLTPQQKWVNWWFKKKTPRCFWCMLTAMAVILVICGKRCKTSLTLWKCTWLGFRLMVGSHGMDPRKSNEFCPLKKGL